jgi:hypothetical protein
VLERVDDRSLFLADHPHFVEIDADRIPGYKPMFWSLVRPDRILPPITKSAAVTTTLEASELAVSMITWVRGASIEWERSKLQTRHR